MIECICLYQPWVLLSQLCPTQVSAHTGVGSGWDWSRPGRHYFINCWEFVFEEIQGISNLTFLQWFLWFCIGTRIVSILLQLIASCHVFHIFKVMVIQLASWVCHLDVILCTFQLLQGFLWSPKVLGGWASIGLIKATLTKKSSVNRKHILCGFSSRLGGQSGCGFVDLSWSGVHFSFNRTQTSSARVKTIHTKISVSSPIC